MLRAIGVALLAAAIIEQLREQPSGTGTAGDPIRLTTHSPLLAIAGLGLIIFGGGK